MALKIKQVLLLSGAIATLSVSGCSTLPRPISFLGDGEVSPTPPKGTPAVGLSFVERGGQADKVKIPHQEGMLVEDALERTRALRRFHKAQINVIRRVPETQRVTKMKVVIERGRVSVGSNYALMPKDIIEIREKHSTWYTDAARTALGPLGDALMPN